MSGEPSVPNPVGAVSETTTPISSPTRTQSPSTTSAGASSSTATSSPKRSTSESTPGSPVGTSSSASLPTATDSNVRQRRPILLERNEPYFEHTGPPSIRQVRRNAKGLFRRSLGWIYAHSLGPVIFAIVAVLWFLGITIPVYFFKICSYVIAFIVINVPTKLLKFARYISRLPGRFVRYMIASARHIFITVPKDLWVFSTFWLWVFFVLMPCAAFETTINYLGNKSTTLLRLYEELGIAIGGMRTTLGWLLAAIVTFIHYRHSLIPYCDPWRDNNFGVVSGFPLSGFVSYVILLPCSQAGAARSSAINNLVQYNHLANVSEAIADHKIDYDHLYWLSETSKTASETLLNKRRKREGVIEYHGVLDLQTLLNKIGPFIVGFLQARQDALEEMKRGLHKYRLQLQYEHDNFRWSKKANFAIGGGVEEFLGKHWAAKIRFDKQLNNIGNHTLDTMKPKAEELYAKLGEGKELFEKIGHYFILNRYLQNHPKATHDQRTKDFYERLGGGRDELEGYSKAIKKLDYADLGLAIDDYLFQFRQARKLLKPAVAAYGMDKLALVYPPLPYSKKEIKERLAQEFDMRDTKLAPLAKDVEEEAVSTERVLRKIDVLLASKFGWKV